MSQTLTKPETQPAPEPTHGLPSPRDFPKADVVIFDGNCNLCIGQVKNVRRFDGKNRVSFISLHDNFVAENFPGLTYDQMMSQIYLVPGGDRGEHQYSDSRHGGAAAIAYLTRRLPLLWIFAPLLNFPFTMPIWQWGYGIVARSRYKIAGKRGVECDENGSCELHFGNKK